MSTSTSYTIINGGIGQLIGYIQDILTTGNLLVAIIGVAILFAGIHWIKSLSHSRV